MVVCRWTKLKNTAQECLKLPAEAIWVDNVHRDSGATIERPAVGVPNENGTFGGFFFDSSQLSPARAGDQQQCYRATGSVVYVAAHNLAEDEIYLVDKDGNVQWRSDVRDADGNARQIDATFVTPSGKIGVMERSERVWYFDMDGNQTGSVPENSFRAAGRKRVVDSQDRVWERVSYDGPLHQLDLEGNELFVDDGVDANGLAVDNNDFVYATISIPWQSDDPPFVRKLDASGFKHDIPVTTPAGHKDVKSFNGPPWIALDSRRNIIVSYEDTDYDARFLKVQQDGSVVWVSDVVFGQLYGIGVDGADNTFVRGALVWPDYEDGSTGFDSIVKFDDNGDELWRRSTSPESEPDRYSAGGSRENPIIVWPGPFDDG